jgi:hypothetical protein
MSTPVFRGTPEQQELAKEIFQIMRLQGSFYSADAPIRQSLRNLADFLSEQRHVDREVIENDIESALQENADVFTREEIGDDIIYITSRLGKYLASREDTRHTFRQRFYEPENPLPVDDISVVFSTSRPVLTSVEPVLISDYWQEQAEFATVPGEEGEEFVLDDGSFHEEAREFLSEEDTAESLTEQIPAEDEPLAPSIEEPTVMQETPAEVVSDQVADVISPVAYSEETASEEAIVETERTYSPIESDESTEAVVTAEEAVVFADEEQPVADELIEEESLEAEGEETGLEEEPEKAALLEEEAEEAEFAEELDEATTIFLSDGTPLDFSKSVDELYDRHADALEAKLLERLEEDPLRRIVHFGRSFYPESGIVSMGKNDLRRIRDYIMEVGEPLLDTAIIADLYYHNPRHSDYEGFRFSLNYRLSREKDFEFVGVEGARLWSTKGLSITRTKRVKISEMGQLTNYLTEEVFDDSLELQSVAAIYEQGTVDRLLSFFEWEYGILPLDGSLSALFPPPLLAEQRSAVLRIESPQHYVNFLVEVRYPTGNRGGWVQGFEAFFHEHLVAGALVTLGRTEEPNIFTITYEEVPASSERLLMLDEKKNKFAFSDTSFYCTVDEDQMVSQQRFGRLKNLKALPMGERRKGDVVLRHVFETIGDRQGSRDEPIYRVNLDDLYVAYNVLRPVSVSYLRSLIESDEECYPDDSSPDIYYYQPEPEPEEEDLEEDLEEEEYIVGGRRWSYGDDDE